ncbi:peptidoglycan DD-metalloendopeptidase family protein [Leptobacterium flavescens]|uniref:Peptidoglycan DD-metalloendopeptidase family protein n=1 Tax=Leptobacterium flavescens TaxID=472055 RepID=A0A6P0UMY6_9FLAO|nr:peptidoglycan DD-metalloendopeptidase family protein [Leptobacterium flavescens]NER13209.1 peptidoglycan DD-metalloendopeptidase family protein [Leptobacterium flavescens]
MIRYFLSHKRHIFLFTALFLFLQLSAQTDEQKALESKRARLQEEIAEINSLLSKERQERKSVLVQVEDIDHKIRIRRELIKVTNQQANILNRQLNGNLKRITDLREELTTLKEDYARMIRKSFKSKSQQSRLMFLLSSDNFFQAYKRLQYMKQYTAFRKKQGEQIQEKTLELQELNRELVVQRREKEKLASENREEQKKLEDEKDTQEVLLATIRKNESQYTAEISRKRREARALDRQIERLIREAIAESNRKAGKSANAATFTLTPEARLIATNFEANKGTLIWPVEKGVKNRGYGEYPDPLFPKTVKHFNNGVDILTDKGAKARAVFDGEVLAILAVRNGNKAVQIRHGDYITTYYNLSRIYVKKGDKIKSKQELGEIFTSPSSGKTELKFFVYKNTNRLNPEDWVYRM